jgi:hypothetical protein
MTKGGERRDSELTRNRRMEPILTKYVKEPNGHTLDFYVKHGGYEGLKKALAMPPNDVIELVKASGLRGRGGAGFPCGPQVAVRAQGHPEPKYICCNADESEPGTFKDHVLMERNPHLVFEGCLIGCWAIGAKVAYIYIRGEFYHVQQVLEAELAKAYAAGLRRQEHHGHRLRLRHRHSPGRGRVRGGGGDGAHRVARGQARAAADQAAVPGRGGALQLPDRGQQRRDALQPAGDHHSTAPSGSPRSAPRRTAARSCSASAATSSGRACTKRT